MHSNDTKALLLRPLPYASYVNSTVYEADGSVAHMGYGYPMELQHMVHQHWRGYLMPEIYYKVGFFMLFALLMLISLFGNGLVLWIFSTSKPLRTPSNLLILNLAIFDLTMCENMPHYLINTILGYIAGGELGCDVYAVIGGISGMGAAITNAFIAYDRYRTISNPIDGRLSYGQVTILIIISWLWTMPFSILPFFRIWGRYLTEGYLNTCSFDYLTDTDETRFFVYSIFAWAYCIPMIFIVTFYYKLFTHVQRHEQMLSDQAKKMNVKSLSANADAASMSVELRIAKAALIIYMLYVFAWTPYAAVALLGAFGQSHLLTPFVSMLPACCCKIVSCLDPWVYAASHPKYRLELERRLPWLGIRERQMGSTSSTGGGVECGKSEAGETCMMSVNN